MESPQFEQQMVRMAIQATASELMDIRDGFVPVGVEAWSALRARVVQRYVAFAALVPTSKVLEDFTSYLRFIELSKLTFKACNDAERIGYKMESGHFTEEPLSYYCSFVEGLKNQTAYAHNLGRLREPFRCFGVDTHICN